MGKKYKKKKKKPKRSNSIIPRYLSLKGKLKKEQKADNFINGGDFYCMIIP